MTTTRYYRWDDSGAPSLTGQAGAFKDMMKALLIGSGGVAYGTGPSAKAAAGWSNAFPAQETSTKIAIRNSLAAGGQGCYLRIDDSNAKYAIVRMYESMSDIDTGTASAASADWYIPKSTAASSATRAWTLAADELTFWGTVNIGTNTPAAGDQASTAAFGGGDPGSYIPGDTSCFIAAPSLNTTTSDVISEMFSWYGTISVAKTGMSMSRTRALAATPTPIAPVQMRCTATEAAENNAIGGINQTVASPAPGYMGDIAINAIAADNGTLRAGLRGLFLPITSIGAATTVGSVLTPVGRPGGSQMMVICGQTQNNAVGRGRLLVEKVLPWG